jgi:hypothetical protein
VYFHAWIVTTYLELPTGVGVTEIRRSTACRFSQGTTGELPIDTQPEAFYSLSTEGIITEQDIGSRWLVRLSPLGSSSGASPAQSAGYDVVPTQAPTVKTEAPLS